MNLGGLRTRVDCYAVMGIWSYEGFWINWRLLNWVARNDHRLLLQHSQGSVNEGGVSFQSASCGEGFDYLVHVFLV